MMLPQGWVETTLSEIVTFNPKHDPTFDLDQLISFVPMPAVDEHLGMITSAVDRPLREVWSGFTHFADGDVIFAKITPCMENGKIAVASDLKNGIACGSTEFFVLRPSAGVQASYIWRYLRQRGFRVAAETQMTGAVGQRRVPRHYLESYRFPLPPEAEQCHIVAKLNALSAQFSSARAELDRVPSLAKQLKSQILRDAFDGRTRSSRLLRARWQSYSAAEICAKVQSGGTPKEGFVEAGIPFLKVYNIVAQQVAFNHKPQYVAASVHQKELKKSIARPGDVLMNIVGPPLGKVAIVTDAIGECNINQAITLFRPNERVVSKWLYYFLCSGQSVASVVNDTRGIAGQVNISLSQCRAFQIPVPPVDEQERIIGDIEAAFTRADRLEAEATRARALLDRLEAAILAKAFRGELVPQDPNDEPASVLLDRIRTERAAAPKPKRGRARKAVG